MRLRSIQGVLLINLLWILHGAKASTQKTPWPCCAPGVLLKDRKCANGAEIALNCTYKFLLDSEQGDKFSIQDDGRLVLDNITYTETYCLARMPHEVAVVCQNDQEPDDPRPGWWFGVLRWLSWLSVACIAVTLVAHVALPELGELQDRCHMGAVLSLGLGMLELALLQDVTFSGVACTAMAFISYYCWVSAFVWLHITSFNVFRSVVLAHRRFAERALLGWYCAAGVAVPLLLTGVLSAAHFLPDSSAQAIVRPDIGRSKCWFHDDKATWVYFYGPSAVLIAPNIVYFVWTAARLWRQCASECRTRKQLMRRRSALSLRLFLVMGISWAFELISSASEAPGHFVWYVTDVFNAMQGLVILVVLVLGRRRVWQALYKRRPCGVRPPERWAYPASGAFQDSCVSTDTEDNEETGRCQELREMNAKR